MFVVLYEDYTEYNQFEGSWDLRAKDFSSAAEAVAYRDSLAKSSDNRNIRILAEVTP